MNPPEQRLRVGTWVRMEIPNQGTFTGFTFIDPQAGFSAQGQVLKDGVPGEGRVIVRLPLGVPWEELTAAEIAEQKLENPPGWVAEFYGPQPPAGTVWGWWQDHPGIQGRFHAEYPDDLEVLVHEGGPRLATTRPELMWVRITGGEGNVFTGRLLNQPHQLRSVKLGNEIHFLVPENGEHPLLVTEKYLAERPKWMISPCNKCGLTELFDAPSDLIRMVFPIMPAGADVQLQSFTAFCGVCGGVQVVASNGAHRNAPSESPRPIEPLPAKRKSWWQFWK